MALVGNYFAQTGIAGTDSAFDIDVTSRHVAHPKRERPVWMVAAALLVLVVSLAGLGGGLALWTSQAALNSDVSINHGYLTMSGPTGQTWQLTSKNGTVLATSHAIPDDPAPVVADLEKLTTVCGSDLVLTIRDSYSVAQSATHMEVGVKVNWRALGDPSGDYGIRDQNGNLLPGSATIGHSLTVQLPDGADAFEVERRYQIPECDFFNESGLLFNGYAVSVVQL
ncbi:MAG: hypothetical protein LBS27_07520 [Bifidobacteriaceae bacterium]|nr:hypothetical protein [Bifidobacteriaceae bacterium]